MFRQKIVCKQGIILILAYSVYILYMVSDNLKNIV